MFTAALFTIAKIWNQSRNSTTNDWMKKIWCIYTMECYLAMKKNEIMSPEGRWIELEIIMLNEINLEIQILNIFSHMQNLDLKNNNMT
jgi:hypothetical protein